MIKLTQLSDNTTDMSKEKKKSCLWSLDAMKRTVTAVEEGNELREAAMMFNVPVESLRRKVNGDIPMRSDRGLNLF